MFKKYINVMIYMLIETLNYLKSSYTMEKNTASDQIMFIIFLKSCCESYSLKGELPLSSMELTLKLKPYF